MNKIMNEKKRLPIGIQTFEKLRNKDANCIYVDKTMFAYQMATQGGDAYFLSRPRRFGKSLLISMLEHLYKGNKALFEGLYIYDKWDWNTKYPVIRLDCSEFNVDAVEDVEKGLNTQLGNAALLYGITLPNERPGRNLSELLRLLHEKTGQRAVLLVDEYDSPILKAMEQPTGSVDQVRLVLHNFYTVVKANDRYLRFVFVTGISKFSKLSLFSAMNNLYDITISRHFATICGYTQQDLECHFDEHINNVSQLCNLPKKELLGKIKQHYNGYSWDGVNTVYNPISILCFFKEGALGNYWFETGTPSFLVNTLRKQNSVGFALEDFQASGIEFSCYDPETLEIVPLLFQTGYLTIKKIEFNCMVPTYTLGIPNEEVRDSMNVWLFRAYTNYSVEQYTPLRERVWKQLKNMDASGVQQSLQSMLASIPSNLMVRSEAWYHALMIVWLKAFGFNLLGEVSTNLGRIDAVWICPEITVVVEVKAKPSDDDVPKLLNDAIAQIRNKRYYEQFVDEQRKVVIMGIVFAGNEVGCAMENI